MSIEKFRALIAEICRKTEGEEPDSSYEAVRCKMGETDITLGYDESSGLGLITMVTEFGAPPEQSNEAILLRLLEANLAMSGGTQPSFGYNPETGGIALRARIPLRDDVTAELVLHMMSTFVDLADAWRESYFLSDEELKSGYLENEKRASRSPGRGRLLQTS